MRPREDSREIQGGHQGDPRARRADQTNRLGAVTEVDEAHHAGPTTYDRFDQLFQQSVKLFGDVTGTDNPDLSGVRKAGGKLVIYHGLADQLIFPQGTINYYRRVQQSTGDSGDFARLFLAPGMSHCAGGPGAQPDNPLNQLVDWVENGKAPTSLNGVIRDPSTGAVTATRPICMYPKVAVYDGSGPTTQASSFACRRTKAEE